jgi:hypothetical protein
MTTQPTTDTDTTEDQIVNRLRDLLGAGVSIEAVEALRAEDAEVVADQAVKLLQRLGVALRAQNIDPETLLEAKPRKGSDRLAEALRRKPAGASYQQPGSTS